MNEEIKKLTDQNFDERSQNAFRAKDFVLLNPTTDKVLMVQIVRGEETADVLFSLLGLRSIIEAFIPHTLEESTAEESQPAEPATSQEAKQEPEAGSQDAEKKPE